MSRWDEKTHQTVIHIEFGGMNDCLYKLYAITKKPQHEAAAHAFEQADLYERVMTVPANTLTGLHANTTIPKFIGALNRYATLDGEKDIDVSEYLTYATKFFDIVTGVHTYITGGNSEGEHFHADGKLDSARTNCNCETCNVYNMLKLSRELFRITGDKKYADYYERAFINQILSSQNPETGMTTYFQPMATGYFKTYSTKFDKFWCCTGSGMESMSKLHDSIYFIGNSDGTDKAADVIVNMFFSSELTLDGGKVLTQRVDDSGEGIITTHITASAPLRVSVRIPYWCEGEPAVSGADYSVERGYIVMNLSGVADIGFPCRVRAEGLPDKENVFGFRYGPYVLSAALGHEDMETSMVGVAVTVPKNKCDINEHLALPCGIGAAEFAGNIDKYMIKKQGALSFTLSDGEKTLVFTPHYKQYTERYGIYWYFN